MQEAKVELDGGKHRAARGSSIWVFIFKLFYCCVSDWWTDFFLIIRGKNVVVFFPKNCVRSCPLSLERDAAESQSFALLDATAVCRQEWKGQRSQHLISIDQVLFQCHPGCQACAAAVTQCRRKGTCCKLEDTQGDTSGCARRHTPAADVCAVLQWTANVSRRLFLLDGNNAALVAPCHRRHKSGLGDYLWRVLLHVWTSSRGHAPKTWRSLQECLLSETLPLLERAHRAHAVPVTAICHVAHVTAVYFFLKC